MKKGDARRMQLIETAERLFYVNGYENTTVQDILDELHFSKGGFYHHFDSKLSLLEAICETRAQETCEAAAELLSRSQDSSALQKLNSVLRASALWQGGGPGFVSLLIGVAYREDGALMRERMKDCQLSGMQDFIVQILKEGREAGELWANDVEGTAQLILRLYTQFTDEVAFLLAREDSREALAEKLTRKLKLYRDAIERILIAPFGSIVLFEADELLLQGWQIVEDRLRREAGMVQMRINL
ncbi:MAG: TetR/AcrR family transcriptional regulator [Clostridiales bacterium]|nr:TetR/AcrR family transcriptional regulator [Clostridiales bacterium]